MTMWPVRPQIWSIPNRRMTPGRNFSVSDFGNEIWRGAISGIADALLRENVAPPIAKQNLQ